MPFPQQSALTFTRAAIEGLNPNQSGCYGLFRQGQWVYVGRADCIRKRLLEHLNGDNTAILRQQPTHFYGAITTDQVNLEKALIVELQPCCNQKVG